MEFIDSLEEKQFVMESNLRRRQLGLFQKVEVGYNLEDIEKEIAKRRMSLGGHIIGLANKKENYNNNDVSGTKGSLHRCYPWTKWGEGKGISDNCEKDRCIYCHIR